MQVVYNRKVTMYYIKKFFYIKINLKIFNLNWSIPWIYIVIAFFYFFPLLSSFLFIMKYKNAVISNSCNNAKNEGGRQWRKKFRVVTSVIFSETPFFLFFRWHPGENVDYHVCIWRTKVSGSENDVSEKKNDEGGVWYFGEWRAIGKKLEILFTPNTSHRVTRLSVRLIYIRICKFFTDDTNVSTKDCHTTDRDLIIF